MPIEPVKIPQNVYIEDRIIGPLTLRQIIVSMLGIGFSYAIWASIQKVYGYVPVHITVIVWVPGALSVIFSFVRINDLSLTHILLLLVERFVKPQTRVYGPRRGLSVNARTFTPPSSGARQKVGSNARQSGRDIDALSSFLDSADAPEAADDPENAEPAAPSEPAQGSAVPPRPVQPGRVKVSPLLQEDLEDLETPGGRSLMRDIFHPPSSHA